MKNKIKKLLGVALMLLSMYVSASELNIKSITTYDFHQGLCMEITNTSNKPIKGLLCSVKVVDYKCDIYYAAAKGEELMAGKTYILGGKRSRGLDGVFYYRLDDTELEKYKKNLNGNTNFEVLSTTIIFADENGITEEAPLEMLPESPVVFYKEITSGSPYSTINEKSFKQRYDYLHYKFNHVILTQNKDDVEMALVFANKDTLIGVPDYLKYLNDPKNELFELSIAFPANVKLADLMEICKKKYGAEKASDYTELSFYEVNSDATKGFQTVVPEVLATTYFAYNFETDNISVWIYGDAKPTSVEFKPIEDKSDSYAYSRSYNQYWKTERDANKKSKIVSNLQEITKDYCVMVVQDKARQHNITAIAEKKSKASLEAENAKLSMYKELVKVKAESEAKKSLDF